MILNITKIREVFTSRIGCGSMWLGTGTGLENALRLLRNLILTRLIAPEAFGALALILAVNNLFESITEFGIKYAIVQNPNGAKKKYLNGAWWLSFTRSLILYALSYLGAPLLAQFYDNPSLIPLMRVAFLSVLLNGMISPQAYVTIKQMNFKRWAFIYHGGSICGVLLTIFLSFYFRNIWALIIGFVSESLLRLVLSYVICPYFPSLNFDRKYLQELIKYVRGVIGLPILTFIFIRSDIFVIGKVYSASELGIYSMATTLAQMPFQLFIIIMGQLLMPVFSNFQADNNRINKSLLKTTLLVVFSTAPALFFVIFYGKYILSLFYGPQYGDVAVPFAIIFTSAMINMCASPIVVVYFANGQPALNRLFVGVRVILVVSLIYPFIKIFGLPGAALAGLIAVLISIIFQVLKLHRLTGLCLSKYGSIYLYALGISLPTIIVSFSANSLLSNNFTLSILLGGIGCLLSYILATAVFMRLRKVSFS